MTKSMQSLQSATKSPFLWGILGVVGFYAVLESVPPDTPGMTTVVRYFTHHPVEYMEAGLFAIGLAALIVKMFDIAAQRVGLARPLFGQVEPGSQPVEECGGLLAQLEALPQRRQGEYYVARLRRALEHVFRHNAADTLDDELKYLSDVDAVRLQSGYGLFRVVVWAIPILGFLGTVIGITMALDGIDMADMEKSMGNVIRGLGLKFDTTGLGLALAMVLMFIHYYVERSENGLLEEVDDRVLSELSGRFETSTPGASSVGDGQLVAVRRIGEAMLQATEAIVERQAQLWQASVDAAAGNWSKMSENAAQNVQTAMSAATGDLARQADVLRQAVEAAGEVTHLEDALNRNLAALAGAKHFEQTVLSLAAAVNMLSARLAESPSAVAPVRLETSRRSAHAA